MVGYGWLDVMITLVIIIFDMFGADFHQQILSNLIPCFNKL